MERDREKRGLSGFADYVVNLELGKHEAVPGGIREKNHRVTERTEDNGPLRCPGRKED